MTNTKTNPEEATVHSGFDSHPRGTLTATKQRLFDQLRDLTSRWNAHEDIPRSEQVECAKIGKQLDSIGGMELMTEAYYAARGRNRAASPVQAYWHGIGKWQW